MDRIQKETQGFINQIFETIDIVFESEIFVKTGLAFIPKTGRYIIVITMLSIPIFAICFVLIFDDDDELPKRPRREKLD